MNKIAIHGFGRIGRLTTRAALSNGLFSPLSISDITDLPTLAALFKADSNFGLWPENVSLSTDNPKSVEALRIGDREIPYFNTKEDLPDWGALGVDVVVDCTGRATKRPGAQVHLDHGAKKVLISAASKTFEDCDAVILPGINFDSYDHAKHHIVSMGSCTTNALAPVVKVLLEHFGIESGFFSTVHAYTATQALTDQPMKDRRELLGCRREHHPFLFGRCQSPEVYLAQPEHYRQGLSSARAHRQHCRIERAAEQKHYPRRSERFLPRSRQPGSSQRNHGRARGRMGLQPHSR